MSPEVFLHGSASSSWPGFPKWWSVTWKYKPKWTLFSFRLPFVSVISAIERKHQHSPTHTVMAPTENNLTLLIYLNGLLFQIRYQTLLYFQTYSQALIPWALLSEKSSAQDQIIALLTDFPLGPAKSHLSQCFLYNEPATFSQFRNSNGPYWVFPLDESKTSVSS